MHRVKFLAVALAAGLATAPGALAQPAVGLVVSPSAEVLTTFDTDAPGTLTGSRIVSGVTSGQRLVGIDYRWLPAAASGSAPGLYGVGVNTTTGESQLYRLDPGTGAAAKIGPGWTRAAGSQFGLDFDPSADRLRLITNGDDNYRVHPDSGAIDGVDVPMSPGSRQIAAAAYDRVNVAPSTPAGPTTLFVIDPLLDVLGTLGGANGTPSPAGGAVTPVGSLGVDVGITGLNMDVAYDGSMYATLVVGGAPGLYRVSKTTGAATFVGPLSDVLSGFTVVPAKALATRGELGTTTNAPITTTTVTTALPPTVLEPDPATSTAATGTGTTTSVGAGTTATADTTPPRLTVTARTRATRAAFLKGLGVSIATDEPAAIRIVLSAKAAKATAGATPTATTDPYDLRLATITAPPAMSTRVLRLRPKAALFGRPGKRVKVQLRVTATDAAGNATTATRLITVGR